MNFVTPVVMLFFLLLLVASYQISSVSAQSTDGVKVRVWLADIRPDSNDVELCVDIIDTGTFKCKRFDATSIRPNYSITDAPVVDAGLFDFSSSEAPVNSTVVACLYVFKTYTGDCSDTKNNESNSIENILLFTRINPAYYDQEDGRIGY